MHVQEIPPIIFGEMVPEPQVFNVRDFVALEWPNIDARDYPDQVVTVGEVEEGLFAKRLVTDYESYLSLYDRLQSGVISDSKFDALFVLGAGTIDEGTWVFQRGNLRSQTLWTQFNQGRFAGAEGLEKLQKVSLVAGKIAARAQEMLESGLFETSTYFDRDTRPEL